MARYIQAIFKGHLLLYNYSHICLTASVCCETSYLNLKKKKTRQWIKGFELLLCK
jgi:hypothetical protein